MAFKLSKNEITQRELICEKLRERHSALSDAADVFNTAVEAAKGDLEEKLTQYNEALAEARSLTEEVQERAAEEIGEKSERWQEGEKGQAAEAWRGEWGDVDLTDAEIEIPEPLDVSNNQDHAELLENLPDTCNG